MQCACAVLWSGCTIFFHVISQTERKLFEHKTCVVALCTTLLCTTVQLYCVQLYNFTVYNCTTLLCTTVQLYNFTVYNCTTVQLYCVQLYNFTVYNCTTFVWNISHFKKNWARCCHTCTCTCIGLHVKCRPVFFCCCNLMKFEFSWHFRKIPKYKILLTL